MGFTETFLDKAKSAELSGYIQVARLDRRIGEQGGGIILFAKRCFENSIVHIGDSAAHERSWFIIHSDRGGILLSLWYRRPARDETESITSLYEEFENFSEGTFRTIIMGDMNVHEVHWLNFSDRSSLEGR